MHHAHPMPNVECELQNLSRYKNFASLELSHDFYKLSVAQNSEECQSFVTQDGIFTPTRVLHGTINAARYLQAAMEGMIADGLSEDKLA